MDGRRGAGVGVRNRVLRGFVRVVSARERRRASWSSRVIRTIGSTLGNRREADIFRAARETHGPARWLATKASAFHRFSIPGDKGYRLLAGCDPAPSPDRDPFVPAPATLRDRRPWPSVFTGQPLRFGTVPMHFLAGCRCASQSKQRSARVSPLRHGDGWRVATDRPPVLTSGVDPAAGRTEPAVIGARPTGMVSSTKDATTSSPARLRATAGQEGLEPSTAGLGDRCATNYATAL
jgi:hypothetical protein